MTDESKLDLAVARGRGAQDLLNNDLLRESFTLLSQSYMDAWKGTSIEDVSGREKLFLAVNIIGKVQDHLNRVASDGKLAAADLKEIADAAERKKRFGII